MLLLECSRGEWSEPSSVTARWGKQVCVRSSAHGLHLDPWSAEENLNDPEGADVAEAENLRLAAQQQQVLLKNDNVICV